MRQVHFQMHAEFSALNPSTPQYSGRVRSGSAFTSFTEVMTAALTASFADEAALLRTAIDAFQATRSQSAITGPTFTWAIATGH